VFVSEILNEKVFGALAIGYHRTHNIKNLKEIGTTGFKAGNGKTYGTGIYLTYDFYDQQDERMKETYGPFIIRAKVNLDGFLIFDNDVAKIVYGIDATVPSDDPWSKKTFIDKHKLLEPQFKRLGLPIKEIEKIVSKLKSGSNITSNAALVAAGLFSNKIKGMVFTGESDGRVIVAYDASRVIPFSWARVIDLDKNLEQVKWNKYEAPPIKSLEKESMSPLDMAIYYFKKNGFTKIERGGRGGHYMTNVINGDYITLNIVKRGTHSQDRSKDEFEINAYVTRNDINPSRLSPEHVPNWSYIIRNEAYRLIFYFVPISQTSVEGLAKVLSIIKNNHAAMMERAKKHEEFAKALILLLVDNQPITSKFVKGKDYGQDDIRVSAGPVDIRVDVPYGAGAHGEIVIHTKNNSLNLGFNDGSKGGRQPINLEEAYKEILVSATIDARYGRQILKYGGLPDGLNEKFKNDLIDIFNKN